MNNEYENVLKSYNKEQYTRVVTKDNCGVGFYMTIELYEKICNILAVAHCPEVRIILEEFNITGTSKLAVEKDSFEFLNEMKSNFNQKAYSKNTRKHSLNDAVIDHDDIIRTNIGADSIVAAKLMNDGIAKLRKHETSNKMTHFSFSRKNPTGKNGDENFRIGLVIGEVRFSFVISILSDKRFANEALSEILQMTVRRIPVDCWSDSIEEIIDYIKSSMGAYYK